MGKYDMTAIGRKLATTGIALVGVGAIAIAPTVQTPPPPVAPAVSAVRLAAATTPSVVEPLAQTNAIGALLRLDLGRFIIPPSWGQPFPTPQFPGPSPAPTDFAGTIKSTYVAIEPWVHYGFQLAQYAVGWVPYVGWLSPQIDIFYHFGERIVRSLVFNSADWLWGPLPFVEGLGNIARDSWNSLVQLGIDQWNFWLPPLPPLPLAAQQAQPQAAAAEDLAGTLAPTVRQVAQGTDKLDPPDLVTPQKVGLPEADLHVTETALDTQRVTTLADPKEDLDVQVDLSPTDTTPTNPDETVPDGTLTDPPADAPAVSGTPSDETSSPVTPLRKAKPFGKKPKPADQNESVGVSNSSAAASDDSVGTPKPPKKRFDAPKKHAVTGSSSDSTGSPADSAPRLG
jgi:hypothetical protein